MIELRSVRGARALALIVAIRLGAGLAAVTAPRVVLKALRSQDSAALLVTQLFGARQVSYALLVLLTRGRARHRVAHVGIVTDLVDSYAAASAIRRDEAMLPKIMMASISLVAALLGVASQAPAPGDSRARVDPAAEQPGGTP